MSAVDPPTRRLADLHGPLAAGELVELRAAHARTGEVYSTWHTGYDAVEAHGRRLSLVGWHCWYGINPRLGRRRGDRNCSRAWALCGDIDAKLYAGDLERTREAVRAFALPPSATVCTGGGLQPRWFLEAPLDLQDAGEALRYRQLGARLARAVCGAGRTPDTVSNPERVLRLPGTRNWKYAPAPWVTIDACSPLVRYRADELDAWLDAEAPWTRLVPPAHAPSAPVPASGVIGDFNARYDPLPLLVRYGARIAHTQGAVSHLTRPGKHAGTSATYNYYPTTLIVFSEAWPPFSPTLAGRRGYDPFEIFSRLEHAGDRAAAYRAARDLGYGPPAERCGIPLSRLSTSAAIAQLVGRGRR